MESQAIIINSNSNSKVKWLRSLLRVKIRQREHLFLAEGIRLLEEAKTTRIHSLVICPELVEANPRAGRLAIDLSKQAEQIIRVGPAIMNGIAVTKTSQGILAVIAIPDYKPSFSVNFGLILDNVRDPGNLGTILRTARAADIEQVYIMGNCTDVYNPKVVRSGMGAHFHLPIVPFPGWDSMDRDVQIVAADVKAGQFYRQIDWKRKTALLIGSEAHGIQSALPVDRFITKVKIPIADSVESLNVAVAAGIILMEAFQARELTK